MPITYIAIAKVTADGSSTTMTFNNIPSTYTDLKIQLTGRSSSSGAEGFYISFNTSTSNFTNKYASTDGTNPSSGSIARYIGSIFGSNGTSNVFNQTEIYIPNYAGSNFKAFTNQNVAENNATLYYTNLTAGLWSDTSAITRIDISCTGFLANSTAYLYGIKKH